MLVDGLVKCNGHLNQFAGNGFLDFPVLDIMAFAALIMVIYSNLYKVSVGVLFLLCVYCFPFFSICNYFNFQKYPTDRAYFIAKEILMTERTYKKDLEVISLVSYVKYLKE